jgi:uncharacterized membrane protein
MTTILVLKLVHLIGAAVLFGTGLGIAFFMYMAHRTGDAATIAATARTVVIADAMFTLNAVIAPAVRARAPLPPDYERLFRIWFALGVPAFLGVIVIFALMIAKPQLW